MSQQPFIVGITGGSASGKTLFLSRLKQLFSPDEICLISQDNYYRPREHQPIDTFGVHNFDTPSSIDFEAFSNDLSTIRSGQAVMREEYTFNKPGVIPAMLTFHPAPIIIVEGIFVFYFPEVAGQLNLKVFIEAKEAIKLKRRIVRDNVERGYDLDDVLYRYEYHVTPTYERYIEPFRHDADIIIPNNSSFDRGLDVLATFLKAQVAARKPVLQ